MPAVYSESSNLSARISAWHLRQSEPLVAERTYRLATNSFLAEGGDRYESLRSDRKIAEGPLLSDCVIEHLRAKQTIEPPPAGRLRAL